MFTDGPIAVELSTVCRATIKQSTARLAGQHNAVFATACSVCLQTLCSDKGAALLLDWFEIVVGIQTFASVQMSLEQLRQLSVPPLEARADSTLYLMLPYTASCLCLLASVWCGSAVSLQLFILYGSSVFTVVTAVG